jgi:hypothetical protein
LKQGDEDTKDIRNVLPAVETRFHLDATFIHVLADLIGISAGVPLIPKNLYLKLASLASR